MYSIEAILGCDILEDGDASRIGADDNVVCGELAAALEKYGHKAHEHSSYHLTRPLQMYDPASSRRDYVLCRREIDVPLLLPASLNAANVRMIPKQS
jgi:hypothetical protein